MGALGLGLVAAVCWGLHDLLVRRVSQSTPLMASLLAVLIAGTIFQVSVMVVTDGFVAIPPVAMRYAILSGVFFLIASLGLYHAFDRGPVRLVAPVIASFPVLSVGWAAMNGTPVAWAEWLAVLTIIIGVAVVASWSDNSSEDVPPMGRTLVYAVIAAVGFGCTFAVGQLAAELSDHLPATLVTRLVAIGLLVVLMFARRMRFWPGKAAIWVLIGMGCLDGIALMSVLSAGGMANAQYAAVASSTFGLLTVVMAWAILRERMSLLQWLGCALAFCGIGYLAL